MAKLDTAAMADGGLDKVATCTKMTICAGQPVSYADIAVKALASVAMVAGDFVKANGDISGRKITVGAKSAIPITGSGTADHVVLDDGVDYVVTTATAQALTIGGTVSTNPWKEEIAAPV